MTHSTSAPQTGQEPAPGRPRKRRRWTTGLREKLGVLVALILLAWWIDFAWDFLRDVFA